MVREPAFRDAQFHTAFLDELLHKRAGKPFFTPDPSLEEVAAVAMAIGFAEAGSSDVGRGFSPANWRRRGREENLGE